NKPGLILSILGTALEVASRSGEAAVTDVLARLAKLRELIPIVENSHEFEGRAKLLERAVFYAGHYDQAEYLQLFITCFLQLVETPSKNSAPALANVAGQSLRSLRKLGLRQEVERLLHKISERITQGRNLAALRESQAWLNWLDSLRTLLQVAAGWMYFNRPEEALPTLQETRQSLFTPSGDIPGAMHSKLASTYAQTLACMQPEEALSRLEELL